MSAPKRYYWLKFKDTFFQQKEIKKLRTIAGGATYTIIYLKMQLLSVKSEGVIKFDKTEKDLAEQLSIELDEKYDDIVLVIAYMQKHSLIESISDNEFLLPKVPPLIGSEGDSSERVRKLRSKKALQCNMAVTKCNTEKREKRKEKEKKEEIPSFINSSIWKDFVEMRNSKKKPLTDKACQQIWNKLKDTDNPNYWLEQSIENSWATVYPKEEAKSSYVQLWDGSARVPRYLCVQTERGWEEKSRVGEPSILKGEYFMSRIVETKND